MKYICKNKGNVIHQYHDMSKGLTCLINDICNCCDNEVVVLFQHPDPTPKIASKQSIAKASLDIIKTICSGKVSSMIFVYDYKENNNSCWNYYKLLQVILSLIPESLLFKVQAAATLDSSVFSSFQMFVYTVQEYS